VVSTALLPSGFEHVINSRAADCAQHYVVTTLAAVSPFELVWAGGAIGFGRTFRRDVGTGKLRRRRACCYRNGTGGR